MLSPGPRQGVLGLLVWCLCVCARLFRLLELDNLGKSVWVRANDVMRFESGTQARLLVTSTGSAKETNPPDSWMHAS